MIIFKKRQNGSIGNCCQLLLTLGGCLRILKLLQATTTKKHLSLFPLSRPQKPSWRRSQKILHKHARG